MLAVFLPSCGQPAGSVGCAPASKAKLRAVPARDAPGKKQQCVLWATGAMAWASCALHSRRAQRNKITVARLAAQTSAKVDMQLNKYFVDEEAMLAESEFVIKPGDLVKRCKEVVAAGVGTRDGGADFADDFEFCAPVVGPINKKEYLSALGTFKIEDAFPDSNPNYHAFRVDPFEPDRVWFQTRKTGTNTGYFMGKPPTHKALQFPPEAYSMRFNEQGEVREFTVGYPMDRRVGNTGGLGGAFGYFYGVGKPIPIPECRPYSPSWQFRFLRFMSRVTKRFQGAKVEK